MKFIFIFLIIIAASISILIIKSKNSKDLETFGIKTTGKVIKVFTRGKLPFCKFSYEVENKTFIKKQDIPNHLKNKILNNRYVVFYNSNNPENAVIKLKKEVN